MGLEELFREQADALRQGEPFAAVTIVRAEGLARTSGKMLVYSDGRISGTVGGGVWERLAVRDALSCLETGENAVRTYSLDGERAEAGLRCGGGLTVFIECCRADRICLVVLGGGHVGSATIRAAKAAGMSVTLVDTRSREEIRQAVEAADAFLPVQRFGDVERLALPKDPFFLICGYDHQVDGESMLGVLRRGDASYIGMLGSPKKIGAIRARLEREGLDLAALPEIHAPVGLDLGGETPEELAAAIVAEILMVRNSRTGRPMSQL